MVPHEHRDEQGEHEHRAKQIEDDKIYRVALAGERLWLQSFARDAHSTPQDVYPSFLRDNLEQNKQRIAKVVEAVIWVRHHTGSQNGPIERRSVILAHAIG